jgi:hypothetical protein
MTYLNDDFLLKGYNYYVENRGRDNLVSEHRFRTPRDRGETFSLMGSKKKSLHLFKKKKPHVCLHE